MSAPLNPLITICGTTGVGKSKLAIELALHILSKGAANPTNTNGCVGRRPWLGARIINADSMQVYRGMDIITNKVPEEEREGVEHLLMSFKQPGEQYVVGQWVQDALEVIDETHRRNEIPIVVGGTSYWIQHLIFPNRLSKPSPSFQDRPSLSSPSLPPESSKDETQFSADLLQSIQSLPRNLRNLFDNFPDHPPIAAIDPDGALALHALLTHLDPEVASRWHWRDTRKVFRSLGIIKESGRRPSEIIKEQSMEVMKPRYQTLCFWLYADPSVLNPRLDSRVDDMIKQGVLDELNALHDMVQSSSETSDYTLGIYQSIGKPSSILYSKASLITLKLGYREFNKYLSLPPSGRDQRSFDEAVDAMKLSTRQYAKRQISWIRNKLLPAVNAVNDEVPTYLLDATELGDKWTENILRLGTNITDAFLEGQALPDPSALSPTAAQMLDIGLKPTDPSAILAARRRRICEICTSANPDHSVMIEEGKEWEEHVRTKAHRRLAGKGKRELESRAMAEEKRAMRRKIREGSSGKSDEKGSDEESESKEGRWLM